MLEGITPILLTFNEEANIARTLAGLKWANDIVVVDSGSTDYGLQILRANSRVRIFQRAFDSHAEQWNYALQETAIRTRWVLALDADYVLTDRLVTELSSLTPENDVSGYRASFIYCINGRPLWGSLYPPGLVLYRRERGGYVQDGHTQRLRITGKVKPLKSPILHDDRKPLSQWLVAQEIYASLEAAKIRGSRFAELAWPDRVRKLIFLAPWVALLYCLLWKGCLLQGKAGIYYAFQRTLAELVLSLKLLGSALAIQR